MRDIECHTCYTENLVDPRESFKCGACGSMNEVEKEDYTEDFFSYAESTMSSERYREAMNRAKTKIKLMKEQTEEQE